MELKAYLDMVDSDLNSKIPVLLEPAGIHAVLSGTGKNYGVIEFTKEEYNQELNV